MTDKATENPEASPGSAPLDGGARPLVPCPLCGGTKGYKLSDGSTYRWWSLLCADCGEILGECRSNGYARMDEPKPERDEGADEAWSAAGKHAQELRDEIDRLQSLANDQADELDAMHETAAQRRHVIRQLELMVARLKRV